MRSMRVLFGVMCLAAMLTAAASAQAVSGYKVTDKFEIGGEGGWDYLTLDTSANRLFVARGTRVQVLDLTARKLAGEIPNTNGVHGVALVEKLGRGVTSNGRDNSATIFDLKTLAPIASVKTGTKPDAILFEEQSGAVWTMNGGSNNITVLDVAAAAATATIALPGRPETAVSDGAGKVYVNLEDKAEIAVVDVKQQKVTASYKLEGCEEPTGLALDRASHRLFSGCHNQVLVVVDAASGRNVAKLAIGQGVDAVAYDVAEKLVFTSNGEGSLSVVKQTGDDSYTSLTKVATQRGAKTMALDAAKHVIYTVANAGAPDATTGRPTAPFTLFVVSK